MAIEASPFYKFISKAPRVKLRFAKGPKVPNPVRMQYFFNDESTASFVAYDDEKIFLPDVGENVPKTVDWRKAQLADIVLPNSHDDGWVAALFYNLKCFSTLINNKLALSYTQLRDYCPLGNAVDDGRKAEMGLHFALRNGIFQRISTFYADDDDDDFTEDFPSESLTRLSGFIRIFPLNQQFLLRAIAQQPVMVGIRTPSQFILDKGKGIYRPSGEEGEGEGAGLKDLLVNAIGYDDEFILLQNSEPSGFKIERGVEGIFTYGIIPVMESSMTKFNWKLARTTMASFEGGMFYHLTDMPSGSENPC